ncbi:MAG: hypothetical protein AABX33_02940 [Nanoarchaeota archaeon]
MTSVDTKGLIEQGILFGMGVVAMTTEKAGQVVGGLMNMNNLNSEDGKKVVNQTVDKAISEVDRVREIVVDTYGKLLKEGEIGRYFDTVTKRKAK